MRPLMISDKADIVLLDTDQQTFKALEQALLTDYQVHSFKDQSAFIMHIEQGYADLIIIAIEALGSAPESLLSLIRHLTDMPVVLAISANNLEQENLALSLGAYDYMTVPFSIPIELVRIKNRILTGRALRIRRERAYYLDQKMAGHLNKIDGLREILLNQHHSLTHYEKELLTTLYRSTDYRDEETANHMQRVAHYSQLIASHLNLPDDQQEILLKAASLHDIGKLGIPDDILLKFGQYTSQEFRTMQLHTKIGYRILKSGTSPIMRAAAKIALTHHEKYDGTGYPKGLVGDKIPFFGRIVAVADCFDALTSFCRYRFTWSPEQAAQYLQEQRGKEFDPHCVDAFLEDWPSVLTIKTTYADSVQEIFTKTSRLPD